MKSKRLIATGMLIALACTSNVWAFSDVTGTDEKANAINLMNEYGIVKGYEDGAFKAERAVTRAEFVKMTNNVFSYKEEALSEGFSDVKGTDWFYKDILKAVNEGYILGFDNGTFQPNQSITREQLCVILDRILRLEKTVAKTNLVIKDKVSAWAVDSVNRVVSSGIMSLSADGTFRGAEAADRGTVAVAYYRTSEKKLVTLTKPPTGATGSTGSAISGGGAAGGGAEPSKPDTDKPSVEVIETMKLASNNIGTTGIKYLTNTEKRADLIPFLENVCNEIDKYVADNSYDLKAAMKKSKKDYSSRPETDQKILKSAMTASFDLSDEKEYAALEKVAEFFGIDLDKVQ